MQNLGQMTRGGNAMRNSNSSNMTSADLSSHLGPVSGGHLYVQFSYERVRLSNDGPTNGQFETRLCVEISPKGDRLTTARRYISEEDAAREFPYEYANFSEYESVPTSGTPLFELPGISQSQIALLTLHNLRSIEDVAKCPPELINFMGMDVIQAATTARKWMQSKSENAPMIEAATKEAELDAKLMAISRQLEALSTENIGLKAQNDLMMRSGFNAGANMSQPPAAPQQATAVDRDLPDARTMPTNSFDGGIVEGLDDLNADSGPEPSAGNPLGLNLGGRKAR